MLHKLWQLALAYLQYKRSKSVLLKHRLEICNYTNAKRHNKPDPDLTIEVIHTSGTVKKLHQLYLELAIPELWIWKNQTVSFYKLSSQTYQLIEESINLPGLTVELVNQCLTIVDELEAIEIFRKAIKK